MAARVVTGRRPIRESRGRLRWRGRAENTHSGDVSVPLVTVDAGSRVSSASAKVSGSTFHGRVRDLAGARVTESRVVYNSDGVASPPGAGEAAFIVDFGRSVSVLGLAMTDGSAVSKLVPWLGTDFAPQMAWFAGSDSSVELTGPETTKLFVQLAVDHDLDEAAFAAACRITTATPPSNVRASVGGRPPFWTYPGVLAEEVEITGLEAELNALAASSPGDVSLDVATDSPGVLTVTVVGVEVSQTAAASWAGKPSTSVDLAARAATTVALPFELPAALALAGVELELSGAFPRWRAYNVGTGDEPGRLSMRVDAKFSVARCLPVESATSLYGLSLLVGPSSGAVHLEVLPELSRSPIKPLAMADVSVDVTDPSWVDVMLAAAVDLPAGDYWLVAKGKTGTVEWVGATVPDESAGPATTAYVSSEGGRWESYPALGPVTPAPQVRVLRLPPPTDSAPLLTFSWPDGGGDAVEVNVDTDTTIVTLHRTAESPLSVEPVDGTATVEIVATATSTGTLSIKRATAVF